MAALITLSPCLWIFVALVDVGLAPAVDVALHAAGYDVLMGRHDACAAVVDVLEPLGQGNSAPGAKSSIGSIAGVLCSEPNVTTNPLSCR